MPSIFPTKDADLLPWLQNFSVKFPIHATPLVMTPAQVTATNADCNMLIYLIQTYVNVIRHDASEATKFKDLIKDGPIGTPSGGIPALTLILAAPAAVPAGVLPRLRKIISEIKSKLTYTEAIGADLGIIPTAVLVNTDPPVITVTDIHAQHVTLEWSKNGHSGVKVQARAQGTVDWTDLGIDLFSPFADTRPLHTANTPEVREYRLCHLDGDDVMQNWCPVEVVTVKP